MLPLLFFVLKDSTMKQKNSLIAVILVTLMLALGSGCSGMTSSVSKPVSSTTVLKQTASNLSANNKTVLTTEKTNYGYQNGDAFLRKYQNDNKVKHIILVEQAKTEISVGTLTLLIKDDKNIWSEQFHCKAYLGKNGLDKQQEGDVRTPSGDYGFLLAFGVKDDPGSAIPYTKLTDTMYLCIDKEYYNQFIDIRKLQHTCSENSEHLIRYIPQYNYALFLDYNKENTYGKGSAIFLHCFGSNPYTLGCISIAEENMIKILKTISPTARICIYPSK